MIIGDRFKYLYGSDCGEIWEIIDDYDQGELISKPLTSSNRVGMRNGHIWKSQNWRYLGNFNKAASVNRLYTKLCSL